MLFLFDVNTRNPTDCCAVVYGTFVDVHRFSLKW